MSLHQLRNNQTYGKYNTTTSDDLGLPKEVKQILFGVGSHAELVSREDLEENIKLHTELGNSHLRIAELESQLLNKFKR